MELRLVRTRASELTAEILGTRAGRQFLKSYGWTPKIPVVLVNRDDALDDVMSMVSIHGTPVYVILYRPRPERLGVLCINRGTDALEVVEASCGEQTIGDLYDRTLLSVMETFRMRFWRFSAVAHAIPEILASTVEKKLNMSTAILSA